MQIAIIIIQQIRALDASFLPLIGAYNLKPLDENKSREGGLEFDFDSGAHITEGHVAIELTWADEYKITVMDNDSKELKKLNGVYFPELISVLNFINEK